MAYFDFPHTRNYDSDLGFLITQYNSLTKIYTDIIADIPATVYKLVSEGKLTLDFTYSADDENITFKLKGVE